MRLSRSRRVGPLRVQNQARILAPGFRPSDAIQRHAAEIMRQRMMRAASPTNLMANALEMGQLVQHLPARVNKLLERLVNNEIEVRVQAIDEALLRIEKGTYGICRDCGEPIAEARLNAIPWTRSCISCKEKQKA